MEIRVVTPIEKGLIPDKIYFKIGEVCEITDINSHTLRFWESKFKVISPKRDRGNQRLYRQVDIETILIIKHLICEERHTLAGAKKYLAHKRRGSLVKKSTAQRTNTRLLHEIKTELKELIKILD